MDDLISRQAVLEATSTTLKITGKENAETVYGYIKKLCDDIKALPSAQQWIPCSERLPYSQEDVLCDEDGHVILGFYTDEEIGWHDTHSYRIYPTAWMPLPEPYIEETES